MLDAVERSLSRLRRANLYTKRMPLSFISDGVGVIHDLDYAGVLGSVGISNTIANKLKNFDGTLQANVMLASLERVKSYLRRIESEFGGSEYKPEEDDRIFELTTVVERNPPEPVPVWAEQWVYVRPQSRAKAIIAELSELLDEVALLVKSSNLPEEQAAVTDLDRAQLIALLETALLMLRAPLVEPGLLKKLQKSATDAASKTAQKGAEQAMGEGLKVLGAKLLELFQSLW
ncbi:hypothetical protein QC756_01315 [Sinorhizobium meliloti]|uniref:hypothetical protein n=1 Tax=Rhizobium meliloti TaxID=382 RepID=UPI00244DA203|nr:hypothetical protein [Sinorhizobium meliloti]WGI74534.1 hypothetical protein QC756_01315 [Sinorhizobium meliloti]